MKKTILLLLGLGGVIGALLTFSPGTIFVVLLAMFCAVLILKYLPASERRFVILVFGIGLFLRMILAVSLDAFALAHFKKANMHKVYLEVKDFPPNADYDKIIKENTRCFFKMDDSDHHSIRGYLYAAYAKGIDNIIIRKYLFEEGPASYGWSGYLYIIGGFYYLFDYSPVAVKLVNCLIGVLGAVFVYKIGRTFSRRIGKCALLASAFFPSLIICSTANFKEPSLILLTAMVIWAFIVFRQTKKKRYLLLICVGLLIQCCFTYKRDIGLILLFSILFSFLTILLKRGKSPLVLLFIIVVLGLTIKFVGRQSLSLQEFSIKKIFQELFVLHTGYVNTGGKVYRVLDNRYYERPNLVYGMGWVEIIFSSARSLIHFLFEPFPWRMVNFSLLFAYLQMVIWYILFFFACVGFLKIKDYNYTLYLPLVFYLLMGTLIIALPSGNVGTVFRHRDILSPFFFVFSAVGISYVFNFKKEDL